jgi:hypothetical protein
MKNSMLLTSVGLCLFSFACGSAESAAPGDGVAATGPQWFAPVEVGEAGASSTDPESSVAESTGEALTMAKIWLLQLPSGSGTSPKTVSPGNVASYSDAFYYKAADGGQMFMDPVTGITTSGSKHPRCEMRESTSSGGQAAWSAWGTNTMTVTGKVLKGSSVTLGQVFNGTDSITLAELQYSSSSHGFKLFYEEAKGAGGSPADLHTPITLNSKYTFKLGLSSGKLTVFINGKQVYSRTPSSSVLSKKFYFKFGNYDQAATAGSVSYTVHSLVENYSAVVVHS